MMMMAPMTSMMRKSIGIKEYLHMMLVLILCCVLCNAGIASSASDINNSFNPYSPSTSGSIIASSSSTAQSMLETYLQTFPINEQQNVLTTVYQSRHHASTVDIDKEKLTTTVSEMAFTTSNSASAGGSVPSTESSQQTSLSQNQNTQQTPVVIPSGPPLSTIFTSTVNMPDNIEQTPVVSHELLGCGPNHREGIGIQKALDWLRDKRSSDYGWENDTHMVILSREVVMNFLLMCILCNKLSGFRINLFGLELKDN